MKDYIHFKENMMLLCEIHSKIPSDIFLDTYWKILQPFSDEKCEEMFKTVILNNKWFPKPSEIAELLTTKREDRAMVAWIEVISTMRRVGQYRSVQFPDPATHDVIDFMGGWPAVADWPEDELKWKEKEFVKLFSAMVEREGSFKTYLPGVHEKNNGAAGAVYQEPLFIVSRGAEQKKIGQ